jgi:hypothetical protein
MTSTPKTLEDAARAALLTFTPEYTIGNVMAVEQTDGFATVRLDSRMPGYAGWNWIVELAVDGDSITILESELVAGDGAVIAPDWVPWADRLRDYEEALANGEVDAVIPELDGLAHDTTVLDDDDDDDDEDDDDDDDDDDEFDVPESLDVIDDESLEDPAQPTN